MIAVLALLAACTDKGPELDTAGLDPIGLRFEEVDLGGNFGAATDLLFLPDGTALLATKSGEVGHLRLTEDGFDPIATFTLPGVYDDLDCGLISLVAAPDFDTTSTVYAGLCTSMTASGVFRFTLGSDPDAVAASMTSVLVLDEPDAENPWHNVGALAFDADGWLFAPFGDKTVRGNGQGLDTPLGAIVRIRPTEDGYETPEDAPIPATPEIWAPGVRSPWQGLFDGQGRYWFGDVGAAATEEVNVLTEPGQNFGWARIEGPCESGCEPYTDPVVWWGHEGIDNYQLDDPDIVPTAGRVAYVGAYYSGSNDRYQGLLDDTVLYGDFCQGFVRGLTLSDTGELLRDEHLGHVDNPVGWAEASDGTLYVASFGACESNAGGRLRTRIYRVLPRFQ